MQSEYGFEKEIHVHSPLRFPSQTKSLEPGTTKSQPWMLTTGALLPAASQYMHHHLLSVVLRWTASGGEKPSD
jgi:hypothetical protein